MKKKKNPRMFGFPKAAIRWATACLKVTHASKELPSFIARCFQTKKWIQQRLKLALPLKVKDASLHIQSFSPMSGTGQTFWSHSSESPNSDCAQIKRTMQLFRQDSKQTPYSKPAERKTTSVSTLKCVVRQCLALTSAICSTFCI